MRKFNITGKINPDEHYYADLSPQIENLLGLIKEKSYFVINRPRQFGKTTVLNFLVKRLLRSSEYLPIFVSFESYAEKPDLSLETFYHTFWQKVSRYLRFNGVQLKWQPDSTQENSSTFQFQENISSFCEAAGEKKVVLLIDEVDAIPETAVLGFLRALREMYLERELLPTFHSVALAGVHDIKNLKARYRNATHALGSASPFNIAIDYELPPFSLENVRQYYQQHTKETGQAFDNQVFTRVHHVTNGHPWLVSMLAKYMVEDIVPDRRQKILPSRTEEAIQKLVGTRTANFESLFKNAHGKDIFPIVLDLLIGKRREYNIQADSIDLGVKYGVFAEENQQLILGNHIYAQVLYRHFKEELGGSGIEEIIDWRQFEDHPGHLDFNQVLKKFQTFMKSKGASVVKHETFKEATAQLLFFAYLDPLVNGKGWTFKEVQSGEGRIDVVCCYHRQKEVVELKLWYGKSRYEDGLEQLAGYLESENLDHGYLLVFDRRQRGKKDYTYGEHTVAGKRIFAWVV